MLEGAEITKTRAGLDELFATGDVVVGAYQCSDCGYGVTVRRTLPQCPMCGGTFWEQAPWRPFTRARSRH